MKKNKLVFVGLSGGVDSAVSAALLLKAGYEVVGVFIKTWHPDFLACNEEEERRDAMRIAAHLNIPFLTFDFENVYKKEVADYMIREYKIGRTPNPDVMCNKHVKFGAFLKKALKMGADYVATGHYAIVKTESSFLNGLAGVGTQRTEDLKKRSFQFLLNKGVDFTKDQSYFLWTLKQEQLFKILFPIGNLKKTEVRRLAKKFNLPVAEKKDSQGICFLGAVDLKEFLKHYIKEKKGKVVSVEGDIIGFHNGVVFHTLGERHGFTITKKSPNDKRYYVIGKDVKKNILVVSKGHDLKNLRSRVGPLSYWFRGRRRENFSNPVLNLENTNWITKIPDEKKIYTAQIRYHGEFLPCKIKIISKNEAEVIFTELAPGLPVKTLVASGQSCVIYDGDICLGGGVAK